MGSEIKKAHAAYKKAKTSTPAGSSARRAALLKILDLGGYKDVSAVISHMKKGKKGAKKGAKKKAKAKAKPKAKKKAKAHKKKAKKSAKKK